MIDYDLLLSEAKKIGVDLGEYEPTDLTLMQKGLFAGTST